MTFTSEKRSEDFEERKTEHFKALAKQQRTSAIIADHIKATAGHNLKWDHFKIFASRKTDYHSKIKLLFIQHLNPTQNTNPTSDNLSLY